MNKLISIVGFGALLAVGSAFASTILTQTPQGSYADYVLNGNQWTVMTGYLTGQHTITSTADFSNLSQLNDYDAVWVDQELGDVLSGAEISALTSYASAGGKLVLVGENNSWDAWNASIMSIVGGGYVSGCFSEVGAAISGHSLANGVGSISSVCGNELTNAGSPEILFSNNLVGVYSVGAGEVLVFLDSNWNQDSNISGYDNAVFAQNIADWIGESEPVSTYFVGGSVSGLTGTGLALQNNGGDDRDVDANGVFVFATALPDGSTYDVTVLTQPTGQTCDVTNGFGTISSTDVLGVAVDCGDVVVAVAPPTVPIPTLSEWALILLTMLIGLMVFANRRRLF
jgi:hypothetical protein